MSERERLIELIGKAKYFGHETFADRFVKSYLERLADQLLENGVIVLPCKMGDVVYTLNKTDGVVAKKVVEISWKQDWSGTDLGWGLILSGKRSNNRYNVSRIGKTVFLTKAEAEKALQKRGAINEAN